MLSIPKAVCNLPALSWECRNLLVSNSWCLAPFPRNIIEVVSSNRHCRQRAKYFHAIACASFFNACPVGRALCRRLESYACKAKSIQDTKSQHMLQKIIKSLVTSAKQIDHNYYACALSMQELSWQSKQLYRPPVWAPLQHFWHCWFISCTLTFSKQLRYLLSSESLCIIWCACFMSYFSRKRTNGAIQMWKLWVESLWLYHALPSKATTAVEAMSACVRAFPGYSLAFQWSPCTCL